jgi:hypothetical protein
MRIGTLLHSLAADDFDDAEHDARCGAAYGERRSTRRNHRDAAVRIDRLAFVARPSPILVISR